MPTYSDALKSFQQFQQQDEAAVDQIVAAFNGLVIDDKTQKDLIAKLQASQGQVTPEDQTLIDQIQAANDARSAKVADIAAKLKALDESTPPPLPSEPTTPPSEPNPDARRRP